MKWYRYSLSRAILCIILAEQILPHVPRVISILPIVVIFDSKGKLEVDCIEINLVFLCIVLYHVRFIDDGVFAVVQLLEFDPCVEHCCYNNEH